MNARWIDVRFVRLVRLTGLMLILSLLFIPAVTEADDTYLIPSISVSRVYDDNLFFEVDTPQSDSFWRVSPALAAGYDTSNLSLTGYYRLDAEYYEQHPELDNNAAQRQGRLGLDYNPTERLNLSLQGQYTSTYTPQQLSPNVGLRLGRVYAESISVSPSLAYQFDEVTTGTAGYTVSKNELEGGLENRLQIATLGVERRINRTNTLGINFIYNTYDFGNNNEVDNRDPLSSKAVTLAWEHTLSPRISFSVAAGPRYFEDEVNPEISASAEYAFETGDLSVNYVRSQTALIGQTEPVNIQYLTINFDYNLSARWDIGISPSYAQTWNADTSTEIYAMNFGTQYQINNFITAIGSYQYTLQRGSLGNVSPLEIKHNVISVGLLFTLQAEKDGRFIDDDVSLPTETPRPTEVPRRNTQ